MAQFNVQPITLYQKWKSKGLLIAIPELIIIVIVFSLLISAFMTAGRFTKGPISIRNLKDYLAKLGSLLESRTNLNADDERSTLDNLFNQVKAHCHQSVITKNTALKETLQSVCENIQLTMEGREVGQRSAWQKLKDTAFGFNEQYFSKAA